MFDIFGAYGYGTSAVLGFMFLSGMLITRSWENSKGVVDFFSRRFLRIFPGYWVCLLVCVFLFAPLAYAQAHGNLTGFPWSGEESAPIYALRNSYLKMEQDFIRGMYHHEGVNFPLWTILSEFACYFMTMIVGVLALGKRFRPLYLGLSIGLLGWLAYKSHGTVDDMMLSRLLHVALYLLGVSAYYYHEYLKISWAWLIGAVVLTLGCGNAVAMGLPHLLWALFPIGYAYIVFFFAFWTPIRNIERRADLSYGIYIYGWPIQLLVAQFGGTRFGIAVYLLLTVLFLLPVAATSWFLVEKPAMGLRKSVAAWLEKRRAANGSAT